MKRFSYSGHNAQMKPQDAPKPQPATAAARKADAVAWLRPRVAEILARMDVDGRGYKSRQGGQDYDGPWLSAKRTWAFDRIEQAAGLADGVIYADCFATTAFTGLLFNAMYRHRRGREAETVEAIVRAYEQCVVEPAVNAL